MIRKTGEEGVIVSIINSEMAEVLVDGTEFPIFIDDIDHPYLHWFTKKNKEEQKKRVLREQIPIEKLNEKVPKVATGIHLAFMPVYDSTDLEEHVTRIKMFIVNHSHYTVQLQYRVMVNQQSVFDFKGIIQPFADQYLHFIDWEMMQEIPRFEWQLTETVNNEYAVLADVLKIRSAKLFEHISKLQQENLPTFRYTLLEDFQMKKIEKPFFDKQKIIPKMQQSVRSAIEIPRFELDLHIESILSDSKGLSNAEMLHLQISMLEKYLQIAIVNKQERMVVIHGIGKGVLRQEVHRVLRKNIFVHEIEIGYQSGYGFGATLVHFSY